MSIFTAINDFSKGIQKFEDQKQQNLINQELQNQSVLIGGTLESIDKMQKDLWAREDEIRKETQAREDTAYQRAVEDMRNAGINPNLMDVNPAESGGGITSATKKEYTELELQMERDLEILKKELDLQFEGNENRKERIMDLVRTIFGAYLIGGKK